jgi:integrase
MANPILTQTAINAFLKDDKRKKLSDGMVSGLRLVKKSKNVIWEFRYKKLGTGKDTNIKIGVYPDISLKAARDIAREYKELLAKGIDPVEYKREKEEAIKREQEKKTFKAVAYEFLELQKDKVSEKRFKSNYLRAFEKYAIPFMGHKKIDQITRQDLINFIKWIPSVKLKNATRTQNKTYTAKEVFNYVKNCLDYALNLGLIEFNPAYGIEPAKILPAEKKEKMKAAIDENKIKEIYKKIITYDYEAGRFLMQFQALTALRNVGLYRLKWEYIDWNNKIITYPPNTYKDNKNPFKLPLTDTLIKILQYFQQINGSSPYVFRTPAVKEETLSNKLRDYYKALEIKDHTPHGWRSSFRTIAREKRAANYDTIELQLNHKVGSDVTAAYMRGDLLEERRELLIWWEKFLNNF